MASIYTKGNQHCRFWSLVTQIQTPLHTHDARLPFYTRQYTQKEINMADFEACMVTRDGITWKLSLLADVVVVVFSDNFCWPSGFVAALAANLPSARWCTLASWERSTGAAPEMIQGSLSTPVPPGTSAEQGRTVLHRSAEGSLRGKNK